MCAAAAAAVTRTVPSPPVAGDRRRRVLLCVRLRRLLSLGLSRLPQWRVIGGGMSCCVCGCGGCCHSEAASAAACGELVQRRLAGRQLSAAHPSDSTIALTVHQPLYPPGRVMHIVRHHPEQHGLVRGIRAANVYAVGASVTFHSSQFIF